MQTILITGGTGLVGTALTKMLVEKGNKVIILTRSVEGKKPSNSVKYAAWDVDGKKIDATALAEADCIVHLAGAGVVDQRWTKTYKQKIVDSRVQSGAFLIESLRNHPNKVTSIISSSAIGWYGADQKENYQFIETDIADSHFLGETCKLWEESVDGATAMGIRVCKIRTGIVLSNEGGALMEFKKPIRLGVAAILGNGKQKVSWIHMDDLCRIFIHAINETSMSGSFNAVAPAPVSNKELTLSLARMMRKIFFIPMHVPAFVLKIIMGESSIEVLKSTNVSCKKIQQSGFTFFYPTITAALTELINQR
jgi:uncharacterized protein (TIGR01777 family)